MIFKRNPINNKSVEIANQIISNHLYVHASWKPVPYSEPLDWTVDPYESITWRYYLHSLDIVGYLVNAYEVTNDSKYIDKAKDLIQSWINNNPLPNGDIKSDSWGDHSTANRVINFIQFLDSFKASTLYNKNFENYLLHSIEQHCDFLEDDKNYTFGNNHGIFQDKSLIEASVLFPHLQNSEIWYKKAVTRLSDRLKRDITESGVHKEHSGAYHIVVMKLFYEIHHFLKTHNVDFQELSTIVYKMEGYLARIVKPDRRIPMTGDSGADGITFLKNYKISNPELKFIYTNGEQGKKPVDESVYQDAGVAVFRNDLHCSIYIMFMAAFHSLTHKHADDLSFVLSVDSTDFFVDSGKYTYNEKEKYRKYFRSSHAHNVVVVNRKTYELKNTQIAKSKIANSHISNEISYVTGIHELYPGVKVYRTLLFLKRTNTILIYDEVKSQAIRTYTQVFNIGKDVNVNPINKKNIVLTSLVDNRKIELLQINPVTEFKNYKGNTNPIFGWQSSKFNEKYPISQLQFSNKSDNIEYKTVINVDIENGVKNFKVERRDSAITFTIIHKNNQREVINIPNKKVTTT